MVKNFVEIRFVMVSNRLRAISRVVSLKKHKLYDDPSRDGDVHLIDTKSIYISNIKNVCDFNICQNMHDSSPCQHYMKIKCIKNQHNLYIRFV